MSRLNVLLVLALICAFPASAFAAAASGEVELSATTLATLGALPMDAQASVAGFPTGLGSNGPVRFERMDVYAPGARIVEIGPHGEREVPRSPRIHLLGVSADGDTRLVLSFGAGGRRLSGSGVGSAGGFALRGERHGDAMVVRAIAPEDALPRGIVPRFLPSEDALASGHPQPNPLALAVAAASTPDGGTPGAAIIAIDTDNEFMNVRFGNDTGAAAAWIADVFATMNLMYLNDLNVQLLQGTTFLRTTTDPYGPANSPADQDALEEFGSYWESNYASVPRAFAALLSGKSSSGLSASGIAWLNAYCELQTIGGGYSVNQLFTNPGVPAEISASVFAHELGHNFGAAHTHCTDLASGGDPTGVNTIDQCFSGESGCYAGATSCPTSGPGHPLGTIMSYCHINSCGDNVFQFHPTHIAKLAALIAFNTPSCLLANAETIFKDGFD